MDKPESSLFGLPCLLFAIPTYLVMMLLAWQGRAATSAAASARHYLATIGLLATLHSVYMASVSAKYGVFCPYCTLMYAVNLLVTIFAVMASGDGLKGALQGALSGLGSLAAPMLPAAGVLGVALAASWLVYGQVEGRIAFDARFARCEAQDMFACAELVPMYREGSGVPAGSEVQARAALKKACDLGMQQACVDRADLACQEGEATGCRDLLASIHEATVKVDGAAEPGKTRQRRAARGACELGDSASCGAAAAGGTPAQPAGAKPGRESGQAAPRKRRSAAAGPSKADGERRGRLRHPGLSTRPRPGPCRRPGDPRLLEDSEWFQPLLTKPEAQLKEKHKDRCARVQALPDERRL